MKFNFILIASLFLASCGREGDGVSEFGLDASPQLTRLSDRESLTDASETWLQHPTDEDIALGQAVAGSYIVAFKDRPNVSRQFSFSNSASARRMALEAVNDTIGVQSVKGLSLLASLNLSRPSHSFTKPSRILGPGTMNLGFYKSRDDIANITKVDFASREEADRSLRDWYRRGKIFYAEPNYISKPSGEFEQSIISNYNDPDSLPWLDQINYIDAMEYLDINAPTTTPVIAVLDSGVDVQHPSLSASIYVNAGGQNKLCTDDVFGCNTTKTNKGLLGTGEVFPVGTSGFNQACVGEQGNCSHGTHVSGIIAARDEEFIGVCPYCSVLVVKVVNLKEKDGKESFEIVDSAIIAGLAYVSGFVVDGEPLVRVINASFGKFQRSRSVGLFIESLKGFGKGILTISAAGNEDTMKRQYPAAFDEVISVSNVKSDKALPRKDSSSNFGVWVDIAAPGSGICRGSDSGILSTVPGGGSECAKGTSMASPVVAGVAGLILATDPSLSYDELRARLLNSAIPDQLYQDGLNNAYRPRVDGAELVPLLGGGVVNALTAIDQSIVKSEPIYSEQRDAVQPGCASLGMGGSGNLVPIILVLPLMLLCKRRRRS